MRSAIPTGMPPRSSKIGTVEMRPDMSRGETPLSSRVCAALTARSAPKAEDSKTSVRNMMTLSAMMVAARCGMFVWLFSVSLSYKLNADLPFSLPVVEVDENDLLPCAEHEFSLGEGNIHVLAGH